MRKRVQSILEYIIVLSAVIVAVIWAARNLIDPAVRRMFNRAAGVIDSKSTEFLHHAAGGGSQEGELPEEGGSEEGG